jgi:hypothetical protein
MTEHDAVPIAASEIAELRLNAGRYRWLRDSAVTSDSGPWCVDFDSEVRTHDNISSRDGEELDRLIDAAMQANK